MATTTVSIPASASPTDLVEQLRDQEDLFFRLIAFGADAANTQTTFTFALARQEPVPADDQLLGIEFAAQATTPEDQATFKQAFESFGGQTVAAGTVAVGGRAIYAIAYRGAGAEWPRAHAASTPPGPVEHFHTPLPAHADTFFSAEPKGEWGGVPWSAAQAEQMHMPGLMDERVQTFRDANGRVVAFFLVTDADIDTDGPNGNRANDPNWQEGTSLCFPGGASCDSFEFPGVVRNDILMNHFRVAKGDFALVCYNGRIVACQVYDHNFTDVGEISIFAARQIKTIPDTMNDHDAATGGDLTKELVTLFFPGSGKGRALSNKQIEAQAKRCFSDFTGRFANVTPQAVSTAQPAALPPAPTGGAAPTIYAREAWGARAPKVASFPPSPARGIVVHNTEDPNRDPLTGDAELSKAFALSREIQHSHMGERGWSDIGQHFTISRGGVIMEARFGTLAAARNGQVVRGAHAGSDVHNATWWGIELEGDFRGGLRITPPQRAALVELCAWLCRVGGFPATRDHIKGHREVKPGNGTDCPGAMLAHLDLLVPDVAQRLGA